MNVLAISSSTKAGSVAVFKDAKLSTYKLWMRDRSHGEIITPAIKQSLLEANLTTEDIDLIAVDKGPGSFTGIRVAINSAKTISYSHDIPIWAEDSLRVMAHQVPLSQKKVLCCLNAFKNEVFASSYEPGLQGWKALLKPKSYSIAELTKHLGTKHILVGDGLENYSDELSSSVSSKLISEPSYDNYPTAKSLGELSLKNYKPSKTLDWESLTSLYLKASAAEEKLKKGLLKPVPKF